jgi:hypothetical protein
VRRTVLWLLFGVSVLVSPGALAGSTAERVTLRLQTQFDPGTGLRDTTFFGTVASAEAGELVELEARECGPNHRFYRVVAGTRTAAGGSWQIRSDRTGFVLPFNAYFRARWRGEYSSPELLRVPATVWARWRPARRVVDVSVSTWTSGQNLRGRLVELQRKVPGSESWMRVRRARLRRAQGIGMFRTMFSVRTRGLTLRVFVPAETGAPCFMPNASGSWRS